MRLQHCADDPDCLIVDGVHTPKDEAVSVKFPDWPPAPAERERGVSDSVLVSRIMDEVREGFEEFKKEARNRAEQVTQRLWSLDAVLKRTEDRAAALEKVDTLRSDLADLRTTLGKEREERKREASVLSRSLNNEMDSTLREVKPRLVELEDRLNNALLSLTLLTRGQQNHTANLNTAVANTEQVAETVLGQVAVLRADVLALKTTVAEKITHADGLLASIDGYVSQLRDPDSDLHALFTKVKEMQRQIDHERTERIQATRRAERRLTELSGKVEQ